MNGSTHRCITKKAIEILDSVERGITVSSYRLTNYADSLAQSNSDTDHLKDLEFVDVEGWYNTGRDNPHKKESSQIDDEPHYKETRVGLNMDLTAFNHFIDIRKGTGKFDDYDGYSYQSAKYGQHEKQDIKVNKVYVDDLMQWWFNDEYVHAPGQEYYENCSPSVWRYSYPNKKVYSDKYAELKARFPLAEYQGKSGKGIPYSVFMPLDNLGRYWYEEFLLDGKLTSLGPALHAVQDAAVPHHASGYLGNYHRKYEDLLDEYAKKYVLTSTFRSNVLYQYNQWKSNGGTVSSLIYKDDYNKVPGINWRVDHLITWLAFRAYREFSITYSGFNGFNGLNLATTERLLEYSCSMSMLLLEKAAIEFNRLMPAPANRVKTITVNVKTSNVKDANTDSAVALFVSSHNLEGGALELELEDIPNVDELERGKTDTYTVNVGGTINANTMKLGIALLGRNGWMPESFTITYKTFDGLNHVYCSNLPFNKWLDEDYHYRDIQRSNAR